MSTEEKKNKSRTDGVLRTKPAHLAQVSQQLYEIGKLPPQAVELEEAVLGALMLEKDALTAVIDILYLKVFIKSRTAEFLLQFKTFSNDQSPLTS